VRNSGATAVVEGVGDHGCEYMTNGTVIVLGSTGRNFAAGMSGGIAYVYDDQGDFSTRRCNKASVDLEPLVESAEDMDRVRGLLERHRDLTGSPRAAWILEHWADAQPRFIKIFPHEYKRVLGVPRAEAVRVMRLCFPHNIVASWWRPQRCSMGKVTGFLEIQREQPTRRKVEERVKDWFEIYEPFPEEKQREQGARCMDCGVPFCHTGCPVNNLIPDWNDLVYNGRWEAAIRRLHATNNFPEFTGRICPAPCEAACVLGIDQPPSPSSSSSAPSSSAPGTRAGFIPSRPSRTPASASPWSAAGRQAWPPRSSCAAPATPSPCTRRTTASAACCATAFPTSSWKNISSIAASSRCAPRASPSSPTRMSA
jgi:glutamate synthase (NADPH/NADH)